MSFDRDLNYPDYACCLVTEIKGPDGCHYGLAWESGFGNALPEHFTLDYDLALNQQAPNPAVAQALHGNVYYEKHS